ncbi:putative N-acetylated-alpha-linked acidic dipeptidase [Pomacea canaliculata]|uniref:putative N-acetylated-alpha-linked acidic dipeptidase n=1 Tax=Pomacea canaliculata TaxID=400727 RepID=UPI000D73BD01|nr:putative N-acetylated-alpha-linked acidic dipeptidase [Pomacea canaliculata]
MGDMSSIEDISSTKQRPNTTLVLIVIAVAIVGGFTIGILIGRFATCPDEENEKYKKSVQEADSAITDLLLQSISAENIEVNLKHLTQSPHIAGRDRDFELVAYLKSKFTEYGLDSVKSTPYQVLLSYPDTDNPNTVLIVNNTGGETIVFDSTSTESNISHLEGVIRPFLAYSPSGVVNTSKLVYVNYGRVEDFEFLRTNYNMTFNDSIVIVRYGKIFRGSKVEIAARYGALGVIIYSDPADYTWSEDTRYFPDTWWLPPSGAQRGTLYTGVGDPLTPGYPSIATAYRYNESDTPLVLPTIPAHAMGYGGAVRFLREMQGAEVPKDWRGGLNIPYRLGPGLTPGLSLRMKVTTTNSIRRVDNVIATLRGDVEPDRYVLLGNHRDAWVYGSIDPSSGTAVMMEVARAMGQLVKDKRWRPRRSIMFCSWGAEEYGLLGSNEWAEQYVKSLGARAVAYVNIDIAVEGNNSLRAAGTPLMYRALYEAAKKVPNPSEAEVSQNRRTVYDTWAHSFPWTSSGFALPFIEELGSGSDFTALLQFIGITSSDISYTYDWNKYPIGSYPLYHTEYETFDAMKRLIDTDFKYHRSVGQVAAEVVRSLADSLIIPFNISDYAWGLEMNRRTLDTEVGARLQQIVSNYSDLQKVIEGFKKDVHEFERTVSKIDRNDPMAIRMVNDQLLFLEKAFLDPTGLPFRPNKKHLIFAESANDAYAGSSFPGLVDLLFDIDKLQADRLAERWKEIQHHFSVLVNAIQAAGYTLRDVTEFLEETY